MTSFFRMPIVYVLAGLVAFATFAAVWIGRSKIQRITVHKRQSNDHNQEPKITANAQSSNPLPVLAKGSDGILRTKEGLRRKVLVTTLGLVPLNAPEDGKPVGDPLDYASIAFVFGETNVADPPLLQVGPREGPPLGWVPANAVVEWETRLMARPVPRAQRQPLILYHEEECLLAVLSDQACAKHAPKSCPIEGEEPPGAAGFGETILGLPILRTQTIALANQGPSTLLEVAALVSDRAPLKLPEILPDELKEAVRHVDVVFAIDTTASMRDSLNSTLKFVMMSIESLKNRNRDKEFRFGLVEYRDHSPSFGFSARVAALLGDSSEFSSKLGAIETADRGDDSIDEAVLDGVELALPVEAGNDRLGWGSGRTGELATKLLVLIGDAPDHARDLIRAQALAARARNAGVAVAVVPIERRELLSRDEAKRFHAQWQTLAQGSFRPIDPTTRKPRPPLVFRRDDAEGLAVSLKPLLDDRFEHARELAARDEAAAEGKLKDYLNARGLPLERDQPVLLDFHRGGTDLRRPDPRHEGRRAPSIRKGWIAEQIGGKPVVTVEVLMSRAELDALIAEYSRFQGAAQGSARDIRELLRVGAAAASGESVFLASDRGEQTFAEYLRRREGLPPPRAESLLRLSQADLLQLDEPTRSALDARLRSVIAALVSLRSEWNDPNRTTPDGLATIPYRLIDF